MKKIVNDFIKENKIELHETGLYLIGKGDLIRFLKKYDIKESLKLIERNED